MDWITFESSDIRIREPRDRDAAVREIVNAAAADLSEEPAVVHPSRLGRQSLPQERLLRTMFLQALYRTSSEFQLMERSCSGTDRRPA
jgi:hypothetical protein